jgi:hypothetical protein
MGSNGRTTDDETRGGISTIARPATRQDGSRRPAAEVFVPADRRRGKDGTEVPPQRDGSGRQAGTRERRGAGRRAATGRPDTEQQTAAGQRAAVTQRTSVLDWPPPAHGTDEAQRTAPGRRADPSQAAPQSGPAQAPHRGPFVVLLCGLLGGALISALVISTTLAQGAFQISKLQDSTSALARQRQALAEQVAQAQSALVIEELARQLGMRPIGELRFIDPKTGQIKTDAGTGFMRNIHVSGYAP